MKAIALISTLTFLAIFGTILITNGLFQSAVNDLTLALNSEEDNSDEAAEKMIFVNLAAQRDRLQRESESVIALQSTYEVEEKLLAEREEKITALIVELGKAQAAVNSGNDAQAVKLSKVYEAMKPASAAPILSSLDMDIVLQILSNMKDRQAAKILSAMNPALAAEISTRMSARGHG